MQRTLNLVLLALFLSLVACTSGATGSQIRVQDAWARPALAGGNSAVYLRLVNGGSQADYLLSGASPAAAAVEIHETKMVDGMMKMQPIPRLEVPAGGQVALEPGGLHIMLIGMSRSLSAGESLSLRLRFERAGEMELQVPVREP